MTFIVRTLVACAALGTPFAVGAESTRPEAPVFADAAPSVGDAELGAVTGRTDTAMIIRAQNTSTVAGNSVVGQSTTGGITFDPQTLQNLSGLSVLSANTGNNVAINSSLNLNVAIRP